MDKRIIHGMSNWPEYPAYLQMRNRCYDRNVERYNDYGGRGICVCQFYRDSFANFIGDLGRRPRGMSIDRKDNNGHYSCGHCEECLINGWTANCHWATQTEQANNTRANRLITFGGVTDTVAGWARRRGIAMKLLHKRLKAGWILEDALSAKRYSPGERITHCPHGHEYTPDNTITKTNSKGYPNRICRKCERIRWKKNRERETKKKKEIGFVL